MTRLAAMEKGEYYPTPLSVVECIGPRITVTRRGRHVVRVFDPCCGEGLAVARLAEIVQARHPDLRVETWGVEINSNRAKEAEGRLTRVICAPFEVTAWSPKDHTPVSILFLNPPYDYAESSVRRRLETVFLERAIQALEPGGLLIFIIPPTAVKDCYYPIYTWCENVSAYRFRDEDGFEQFKQLVVVGNRKPAPEYYSVDWDAVSRTPLGMLRLGRIYPEQMPTLDALPEEIPCVATTVRGKIFRVGWSASEIAERITVPSATLVDVLRQTYAPEEQGEIVPLMPPKRGHMAQIIAAGIMGTLRFPGEVIKGRAVKVQELIEETTTDESTEQTYRDRYENHIVRVTPGGVQHLASPSEVRTFLEQNADRLAKLLEERLHPYGNNATPEEEEILARLGKNRKPLPGQTEPGLLPAQRESAVALTRAVRKHGVGHLVAEMGFGKTTVALAAAELLNAYPVVVMCPPQMVEKWARETTEVIPGSKAVIVESLAEFQDVVRKYRPGDKLVVVISRSWAKLGSGWEPSVAYRHVLKKERYAPARWVRVPTCPVCGGPVTGPEATEEDIKRKPHFCTNTVIRYRNGEFVQETCGAPLFQVGTKLRRYPLAEYIAKKERKFFRLLVVDEVHQYKAKDSDQGWAFHLLAKTVPWKITLTGTFFGGPSTSIFWLLHRSQGDVREEYGFSEEERWIDHFGVRETRIIQSKDAYSYSYYRGRKKARVIARERPGVSPAIIRFLLPTVIFRTLADLGVVLPPYRDGIVRLEMTPEQEADYTAMYDACWAALRKFWPKFTASWLQWSLARPNSCFREEVVEFPDGERMVLPPVIRDYYKDLLPKEIWLLGCVTKELQENRKVVVYLRETASRDIRQRIVDVLRVHAGIEATVLNQSVDARKRERWLKERSPRVLITNPRLVETGLDLVDYATAIWYEPDYSLYTLWQACRRIWRLGQTQPVKVYYLLYTSRSGLTPVLEEIAMDLIGRKMAFAQLLYGEDVGGAIVPDMDDNLVVQILRSLERNERPEQVKQLFGPADEDLVVVSAVGSPTRQSQKISTRSWDEWRELAAQAEREQPRQPRRPKQLPPPNQLRFDLGF